MVKKLNCVVCFFILVCGCVYADEINSRPKTVHENAVWMDGYWLFKELDQNKTGYEFVWYSNGQLSSKVPYINGVEHGIAMYWGVDGGKSHDLICDKGKIVKIINYKIYRPSFQKPVNIEYPAEWDEKTQLWVGADYDLRKTFTWFMNGEKRSVFDLENTKLNGKGICWYKDGQVEAEGILRDGKYDGIWKYWDEKGKMEKTSYYRSGELIWSVDLKKVPPAEVPKGAVWERQLKAWKVEKEGFFAYYNDNGRPICAVQVKDNGYNGEMVKWDPQGKRQSLGYWKDSRKDGKWVRNVST